MFLFFDDRQDQKNENQYKGKLFENLLSEYLSKNGYDIAIRQKHNSLEYDLEGIHKTTEHKIIGEAKAYQEPIRSSVFTSFVGKLMGVGLIEKEVHGLFLSTSTLTSEAIDYYKSVKQYGITIYTGEELYLKIIDSLSLPTKQQVFEKIEHLKYTPLVDYILTTNYDYHKLAIVSSKQSTTPSFFIVFNKRMEIINDIDLLKKFQANISELNALEPITKTYKEKNHIEGRMIQKGLMLSKDWTDYRLPASPQFFVGRKDLIGAIVNLFENNKNEPRVVQIRSRSGVGKSSTLAILNDKLLSKGYNVELHDARDIKSVIDIYSIIGRFIGLDTIPQNYAEIEKLLMKKSSGSNLNIFIVDQFESTFLQPEIFNAYETIAKIICDLNGNIFFCLARKNDQLTTYDDSQVSIHQLNSISKNFELKDFSKEEAKELLDNISLQSTVSINKDVLTYVLEFAQGFPWLLKRTMAHILKLSNEECISQKQLIETGLMLEDLFKEELEGLEEPEKEYLAKICSKLPADFNKLQHYFDYDKLLPKMLDKLTQVRLLRLTGNTYDTYNDVFKEYLVDHKLPEFRYQHIYRLMPASIINFFSKIVNKNKFNLQQLSKTLKISQKSLANLIKECRNFGLIKKEADYWVVPNNIKDIFLQGHLGIYLRRQILNNHLVINLLKELTVRSITYDDIRAITKISFPYVEASEATWNSYTNVLIAWLKVTKIIEINNEKYVAIVDSESLYLDESLGNLSNVAYGRKRTRTGEAFLPTVSWNYFVDCFKMVKAGDKIFEKEYKKAYTDLSTLGIIEQIEKFDNANSLAAIIKSEFLKREEYLHVWKTVKQGGDIPLAVSKMILGQISEATLLWRTKRLMNWGKSLGLIDNIRYSYKK